MGRTPLRAPTTKEVGAELGIEAFGAYQVELPPGGRPVEHDQHRGGAEDLYAVIGGDGNVVVDGEGIPVRPGTFVVVTPGSARSVHAGDGELGYIAVCATPRR